MATMLSRSESLAGGRHAESNSSPSAKLPRANWLRGRVGAGRPRRADAACGNCFAARRTPLSTRVGGGRLSVEWRGKLRRICRAAAVRSPTSLTPPGFPVVPIKDPSCAFVPATGERSPGRLLLGGAGGPQAAARSGLSRQFPRQHSVPDGPSLPEGLMSHAESPPLLPGPAQPPADR